MMQNESRKFTLIELIAVVTIVLVLFVIAVPKLAMPKDHLRIKREAELLRASIRYAQTLAMRDERSTQTSEVELTGTGYSITSSGVIIPLPHTGELNREFDEISSPAVNLQFNSWGVPVDVSGNELTSDMTVTLQLGTDLSETVTVLAKTGFVQ